MSHAHIHPCHQSGFTIVELLVAMTIGLFMVGAVSAIYVNTRTGFDYAAEVARIQETGRFGLEAMARDIRMAGYNGCGKTVPTVNVLNSYATNDLVNFDKPIKGYDNGSYSGSSTGTDAIVVMSASPTGDLVVKSHTPSSAQIDTSTHSIQSNEILMVTDCSNASIFQMSGPTNTGNNATNVVHNTGSGTPGNSTKFLGKGGTSYTYKPGSVMMRLRSTIYYVADASSGGGLKSLYAKELENSTGSGSVRELLTGVDDMQIAYAESNNGNISGNYKDAGTVSDWSKVVAVRISLLVRSTNEKISTGGQPYSFMTSGNVKDTTTTPAASDRLLRQGFTETVILRNRTY